MLEHLKAKIEQTVQQSSSVILSTSGPVGLQAGRFPCRYEHPTLYLLIPATLDLLMNLETPGEVWITAEGWQMRGWARQAPTGETLAEWGLLNQAECACYRLIRVQPIRIHLQPPQGEGYGETIDFDDERK